MLDFPHQIYIQFSVDTARRNSEIPNGVSADTACSGFSPSRLLCLSISDARFKVHPLTYTSDQPMGYKLWFPHPQVWQFSRTAHKTQESTLLAVILVAQLVESACNAGDLSSIPGSGRSPGGGTWRATVHGVAKSWVWLSDFTFTFSMQGA